MASSDTLREQVAARLRLQGDVAVAMARVAMKRQRAEAPFDTDLARPMADAAVGVVLGAIADEIKALPNYGLDRRVGSWVCREDVLAVVERLRGG